MFEICDQFESPIKERFLITPDYEYSVESSGTPSSFEGSSDIIDNVLFSVSQNHKTLSEYTDIMLANLENHENVLIKFPVNPEYTIRSTKYDRKTIVDWIIWICYNCQFNDETLFCAISIFDRYMLKTNNENNAYVAIICSLWISTKLNEVRIPTLESMVEICNNVCSTTEILNFETVILNTLKFNIIYPTYSHFTESLLSQIPVDDVFENYVSLFCHCALLSEELIETKPSHISLASIILAKIATDTKMSFSVVFRSLSSINEKMLIDCLSAIAKQSKEIYEKYESAVQMKFEPFLMININDIENIEKKVDEIIPNKPSDFLDNI
ncbi:hypothetical protein M9Y10_001180 [Tritrichomonas musculus]|uniref:Cyclin, N-terminal domain containing protein n=1 Tax=Tritrichomonas musculus TaxID=1915356 RepID=A0ABR2L6E5_9EUKA